MAALRDLAILDSSPEPAFDELTKLASTICQAPMAAVSLVCDDRVWLKAQVGLGVGDSPIEESFCVHPVSAGQLFVVPDATQDSRFADNPNVTGGINLRFYAGAPLIGADGISIGALCVGDHAARPNGLTQEQAQALGMLARQVVLQMELRRAVLERDRHAAEQREAVAALSWLASHDPLTGLGNRTLLREVIETLEAEDERQPVGFLTIDLDFFKHVNDSYGHQVGDELLKEVARRLARSMRPDDVLVRIGGDEFAVLLHGLSDPAHLAATAQRLLAKTCGPHVVDGRVLECRVTIGGALYPGQAASIGELMSCADAALYDAKHAGRGTYAFFSPQMRAEHENHMETLRAAREALAGGWIVPFYQPKVDIADGTVLGLEALLRVAEPGRPVRSPASIAGAFEDFDLSREIGATMLRQVLADVRRWMLEGVPVGRVAINVSAAELDDPAFATRFLATLEQAGVPTNRLELEILETVLLDRGAEAMVQTVKTLSAAGVRIAFDDFGTGYAALAHLPRFPVDVIKIDQSFVRGLDEKANCAIVGAMVALASELGLDTVAEGVETTEQAAALLTLGCTFGQGFLYSPAVPAAAVAATVSRAFEMRSWSAKARAAASWFDGARLIGEAAA